MLPDYHLQRAGAQRCDAWRDLVAMLGIGGLRHLGVQFASKFGYTVVAIGRASENAALAKKLGASVYINDGVTKAAEELQKLGGAERQALGGAREAARRVGCWCRNISY
jgi:D-arabinose 1-dehydrogenase-like Zn-dependent alcohol dehydrogenase